MLSWRAWAAGLLVLAALAWFVNGSQSFQDCKGGQQSQHSNNPPEQSLPIFTLVRGRVDCLGTFVSENDRAIEALATLIIAVFTFTLWWSTYRLWKAGERQIEIARDAADAAKQSATHITIAERAWVFAGPDAKSTRNEPGLFEVKLWIKNYGKTPGFVKVIWARFSRDAPYDPVPKYEGAEKIQTELVLGTQEGFLWPKPFGTAFGERYFYGYIRYVDIFKAVQVSRFCVRLVPEEGRFEMAGGPAWNDHYTEKSE
jgi:hypothetical protein